jgi:S-methylmethionine-dependent homocysteine/selenocysteine methylase
MTMSSADRFRERLRGGPPLVLDAAMGSDLDRRGLATRLPLWSAIGLLERPDLVRQIHVDNLRAGADIITTNTFRSTPRTLRKAGLDEDRAAELDALAVRLAREAIEVAGRPDALVAGSIAPLDECYAPTFDTPREIALDEHRAHARGLADAGVDFLLIETMPTIAEAEIALEAAKATGLPVTVGFVCAPLEPGAPVRLMSGEPLAEAARRLARGGPDALFINCAAPEVIAAALPVLREASSLPVGAYANVGQVDDEVGWSPSGNVGGEGYADRAGEWLALGARVVGGCCGTHPEHTAALRRLVDALGG